MKTASLLEEEKAPRDDLKLETSVDLTFGAVFKTLSSLSLPTALSYTFSFQLVFLVYFLSRIDENEDNLASISLITTLINAVIVIGISPLFAMSMVAGHEIGALAHAEQNQEDEPLLFARRAHIAGVNRNGLLISAAMMPFMAAGMVFSKPLLTYVFRQEEPIAQLTQDFVRPYALVIPGMMVRLCSEQVMFSFGRTKPAMVMAIANFAISMTLSGLLSFGRLGFPKLGKTGLLIGCITESYLTAIAFSLYIAKHSEFKAYHFFDFLKPLNPNLEQLKKVLKLGQAFLFAFATETILALVTSMLAGLVGTKEQAAFSGTMQYALFTLLLQAAFGQCTAQEMSREMGKKHYLNVSRLGKYSLPTTFIYTAPVPIIFSMTPTLLMTLLGDHDEAHREILRYLIPIISVGCILDSLRFNLLQQLRVLKDARGSTLVSTGFLVLGAGTSALLGLKTKLGVYGVALGYTGGIALATFGLFYRRNARINVTSIEAAQLSSNEELSEAPQQSEEGRTSCWARLFSTGHKSNVNTEFGIELKEQLLK